MRKLANKNPSWVLACGLVAFAVSGTLSCNPTAPRKPATTKKADPPIPGAGSPSNSPNPIFSQDPNANTNGNTNTNPNGLDADGNPINPGSTSTPAPTPTATPPTTGNVTNSPGVQPMNSVAPSTSPSSSASPSPSPSASASTTAPPDPVISPDPQGAPTLVYKTFFKPAEPDVPNKRHGSWNLDCLSIKNEAGAFIESSVCNKKISNSCYVYHDTNYGIAKSVNSSLIDNGIEIRLAITSGASYCSNGQKLPSTDARKDTSGFIYLNSSNVALTPEIVSSTSNPSLERFKCAKKPVTGGFKYKVCIEDSHASNNSDPQIWDFNDFIVILESSKELGIAGVTCVENGPSLSLADSTCK